MPEQIELIVDTTNNQTAFKRGWVGDISISILGQIETYRVACKSKHLLKNGKVRLRFVSLSPIRIGESIELENYALTHINEGDLSPLKTNHGDIS